MSSTGSPSRKNVKVQPKTPRKKVIPKVSPDLSVDVHSSVQGRVVVQSSKTDVNNHTNDVDVDDDDNDDDDYDDDVGAQKLKDVYEWIAPVPRGVVDMRGNDVRWLFDTEVKLRRNIFLDPVVYYNALKKMKSSGDLPKTNFSDENALEILVSIYELKKKRMNQLLQVFNNFSPNNESVLLEWVHGSFLSLIELEHTKKAIPGQHALCKDLVVDFQHLFNSMETRHNKLRESLKGVTTHIFLYFPGLKWNENYNQNVECAVNNLVNFDDSSSSSWSSSSEMSEMST